MSLLKRFWFAILAVFCGCSADPQRPATNAREITVGGLYASRDDDGKYRISKVLVVDEFAVHLRSYANRFDTLPQDLDPAVLSLGGIGDPDGFGIGHFPLAKEGFWNDNPVLIKKTAVNEDELEGYKLYLEAMEGE